MLRRGQPDCYPTPAWGTRALIRNEGFAGEIWDPACGDGAMAQVLRETGQPVIASDLYDWGYGETGLDFLTAERRTANIVTNPPFNLAEQFVAAGLARADAKAAFLLRLAFLEGVRRLNTIFHRRRPARIWVFSERLTMYPIGREATGSSTTAHAWFVWDAEHAGPTEVHWLGPGLKRAA